MTRVRKRGEEIRNFIIQNVEQHPSDIASIAATKFDVTRQAINKHLAKLVEKNTLSLTGNTKNRRYSLAPSQQWRNEYSLTIHQEEDLIWRKDIQPRLANLPENVLDIWNYGFTEMFNNVIDHSGGSKVLIQLEMTAESTELVIIDDGIGIFKKIQNEIDLLDERHAILELSKGKLTTDPDNHSGEGIFFTSRMFDDFNILSGGVYFSHTHGEKEDWILERDHFVSGTSVWMKISNHTSRTSQQVFRQFASDELGFNKTVVPVRLAQYGNDKLVSRSQAKRLLARVDRFTHVLFDFTGVEMIGQAFADEIFRVFDRKNPDVTVSPIKANKAVQQMINRVITQ